MHDHDRIFIIDATNRGPTFARVRQAQPSEGCAQTRPAYCPAPDPLSRAIVDCIFDVAVRPICDGCGLSSRDEMRYADFVYFMLSSSEEDKGNAASIQF